MVKKYHINSRGEVGRCRADNRQCPFGGDSDHYDTPEAAQEAYEKKQGGSFGSGQKPLPKVGKFSAIKVAETSQDPDELFAVASKANKAIAHALGRNPSATAEALVEALSHNNFGNAKFTEALATHPNYPIEHITLSGAYYRSRSLPREDLLREAASKDISGTYLSQVQGGEVGDEMVSIALANPHNDLGTSRAYWALESDRFARQAMASGLWPTAEDMNPSSKANPFHKFDRGKALLVARESSNPKVLQDLYENYNGGEVGNEITMALMSNDATPEEVKQKIVGVSQAEAEELRRRANNLDRLAKGEVNEVQLRAEELDRENPTIDARTARAKVYDLNNLHSLNFSAETRREADAWRIISDRLTEEEHAIIEARDAEGETNG